MVATITAIIVTLQYRYIHAKNNAREKGSTSMVDFTEDQRIYSENGDRIPPRAWAND